ncbi:DUF6461 domain-containing protein [Sphaerisporangium sp. B11E5]|uniref:DUF6461 domain-containing protein n=1 Tax=Sphaerisporangium sp. B11E5 TaxID=3153563 RepID=UPI00325CA226
MNDLITRYKKLLQENWTLEEDTTCLTWFNGCDIETAVSLFGADPRSAKPMDYPDARDEACVAFQSDIQSNLVLLGTAGTWNIAVEPYGWEGLEREVIEGLAGDGDAISLLIAAEAIDRLVYAHKGTFCYLLRRLDDREYPVPDSLEAHMEDLPLFGHISSTDWRPSALALIERFTGAGLTWEWLSRHHTLYQIRR